MKREKWTYFLPFFLMPRPVCGCLRQPDATVQPLAHTVTFSDTYAFNTLNCSSESDLIHYKLYTGTLLMYWVVDPVLV